MVMIASILFMLHVKVIALVRAEPSIVQSKYSLHTAPFTTSAHQTATCKSQKANYERYQSVLSILELRGGSSGRGYGSNGDRRGAYEYDDDYNYPSRGSNGDRDRYYEDRDYDRGYENSQRNNAIYNNDENNENYRDYYEDDIRPKPLRNSKVSIMDNIPNLMVKGNKKIGFILLGAGCVFTLLGISLFFNKTLMRLGNLFFLSGVPMTIGPGRTAGYFLQPKKARATSCLCAGIFLVMVGWPIFGIALEIFGLLNLFGNMFPVFMVLLKQVPFVGNLLNGEKKKSRDSGRSKDRDRYDDYYRDDYREDYTGEGYRNDERNQEDDYYYQR